MFLISLYLYLLLLRYNLFFLESAANDASTWDRDWVIEDTYKDCGYVSISERMSKTILKHK